LTTALNISSEISLSAANRLADFLRKDLGHADYIPLHSPAFEGGEKDYLAECVDSGWVSTAGPFVERFEAAVAEICGTRHAVATVNGTAAQHVALVALGVMPGDAVVLPALSFIATANAVSYTGATPLFADIDRDNFGLAPGAVERLFTEDCEVVNGVLIHKASGCRIAATVAVDIFGHPADLSGSAGGLAEICTRFSIPLLEDAAEALGSQRAGRPCGSFGAIGFVSFNGNKIVTTGGGGMLTTNDPVLAEKLKHLTTTARKSGSLAYDHDMVGFNYRMPNLNAALGIAQLESLTSFVSRKRRLAEHYRDLFSQQAGVSFVAEPADCTSNYWLNTLLLEQPSSVPTFIAACEDQGIMTRPAWRLLPDTSVYKDAPIAGNLDVARELSQRLVNIPSSAWLLGRDDG
jgi:perosamine synthetase